MVEVLGVLALMGILSVVAVAGFRVMVNKNKANTVISEAKLAFIEAHAKQNVDLNKWEKVSFDSSYGYNIQTMRDYKSNDYVKVSEVAKEVCAQMLPMQVEGQLAFYTDAYEELTACADQTNIVMAWNGIGVPAECGSRKECNAKGDYGDTGFPGFCNSSGHCQECNPEYEELNDEGTACDCKTGESLSCSDEEGNTWCCSGNTICGTKVKECLPSDGMCSYTMTQQEQTVAADCSYSVSQSQFDSEYDLYNITMIPKKTCTRPGEYCYLYYREKTCTNKASSNIGSSQEEELWGTCVKQTNGRHDYSLECNFSIGAEGISLSEEKGCPAGEYCYLKWTGQNCTPQAGSSATGPFYGVCLEQEKGHRDVQCSPPSIINIHDK